MTISLLSTFIVFTLLYSYIGYSDIINAYINSSANSFTSTLSSSIIIYYILFVFILYSLFDYSITFYVNYYNIFSKSSYYSIYYLNYSIFISPIVLSISIVLAGWLLNNAIVLSIY